MTTRFLLAVVLVGCGGSSSPQGSPDAGDLAPDAHVNLATFDDQVFDTNGAPVPNALVCLTGLGAPQCATTDADGKDTLHLEVPDGDAQVAGVTTADGYLGVENLFTEPLHLGNDGFAIQWIRAGVGMFPEADATTLLATQAGFTYPTTTTGFARIDVLGPLATDHPTATATITGGATTVYTDADGVPDPTLTEGPRIYFGNVEPGTYDVTIQSTGRTCTIIAGGNPINGEWPAAGDGTLSIAVSANVLTQGLVVNCF